MVHLHMVHNYMGPEKSFISNHNFHFRLDTFRSRMSCVLCRAVFVLRDPYLCSDL